MWLPSRRRVLLRSGGGRLHWMPSCPDVGRVGLEVLVMGEIAVVVVDGTEDAIVRCLRLCFSGRLRRFAGVPGQDLAVVLGTEIRQIAFGSV